MPATVNKYLNLIELSQLDNWSVQTLLDSTVNYSNNFELARIGEFLIKNRTTIDIEDDKEYRRVTVKINNNGVLLRDIEKGINIGTKKQYLAKAGQFIVSRIDARNGAFGIIPEELDGAIVTNDFPLFDVNQDTINPQFLLLITSTKEFVKFAQSCSSGTTNRQRMDIDMFLNQKVPLPSIFMQHEIVENYNKKSAIIKITERECVDLDKEIKKLFFKELGIKETDQIKLKKGISFINYEDLSKWSLSHLNKDVYDFDKYTYKTEKIKNMLLFFEGGKTPSKSRGDFWNGEIFWTSPKDFNGSTIIEEAEDTITQTAINETGIKVFPRGIFLSVFRSGILRHSFPTAITNIETAINQDVKAYALRGDLIEKYYYLYFVNTFKKYILSQASKKSVTVESVNTEDFFEIRIPLPPMEKQLEISNKIGEIKNEINKLRSSMLVYKTSAIREFADTIFK
ncbi:restriction endonuclease subunit S [Dyadobacter sp. NIV53]|uniref:restriction endonuclease subunit S n=1 Tax=Dyadobacter sp. NIV53 TaxID=2861765 RepID=UPI001C87A422|nr:restriction endonuclease subunit S [Dyadobacter sp. NIV53]